MVDSVIRDRLVMLIEFIDKMMYPCSLTTVSSRNERAQIGLNSRKWMRLNGGFIIHYFNVKFCSFSIITPAHLLYESSENVIYVTYF